MLEALRTFLDDVTSGRRSPESFESDDHRVAAVALLVHLANADGTVAPAEQKRLQRLVQEHFARDADEAARLIAKASAEEREAIDLFHFTHLIKRSMDETGRQAVVEALWGMAYADGTVHEFEENIIWRVAELLGVSSRERVELRQHAEREGPEDTSHDGPWGPRTRGAAS